MVHMHHEDAVERGCGNARVVGQPKPHRHIVEPFARHPLGKMIARRGNHVLRQNPSARPDHRRQPDGGIAFARADIGDRHPARNSRESHYFLGLAQSVARILGRKSGRHDRRDGAIGGGEARCLRLGSARGEEQSQR